MNIISLGGSIIAPDGLDINYIKKIKVFFENRLKKEDSFLIVVGGGGLARSYQQAAKNINPNISSNSLDFIGIKATRLNASLLLYIFEKVAYPEIIADYNQDIPSGYPLYFAGGFLAGHSTDLCAVGWAENLKVDTILNFTNVDYVYDKDPKEFNDAKPIKNISWEEYGKIFGLKWKPGINSPFDPVAAQKAKDLGLKVVILNGKDLENVQDYLEDKDFKGTVISG